MRARSHVVPLGRGVGNPAGPVRSGRGHGAATSRDITDLQPGTIYTFLLAAVDLQGAENNFFQYSFPTVAESAPQNQSGGACLAEVPRPSPRLLSLSLSLSVCLSRCRRPVTRAGLGQAPRVRTHATGAAALGVTIAVIIVVLVVAFVTAFVIYKRRTERKQKELMEQYASQVAMVRYRAIACSTGPPLPALVAPRRQRGLWVWAVRRGGAGRGSPARVDAHVGGARMRHGTGS